MTWQEIIVRIAVPLACSVAVAAVTALVAWLKGKIKNKKAAAALDAFQTTVENIAATVEQLFDGTGAANKLWAFKDICARKGLDVDKATAYLETHIIPTSKNINAVPDTPNEDDAGTD